MVRAFWLTLLLELGVCWAASAQAPVLAVVHGTLIDGTGAEPLQDAVVLIEGDRIVAVGQADEVAIPDDAQTLDATGCTVLPGFINAHVHAAYDAEQLARWASAGVTTVRDVGTFGRWTSDRGEVFVARDALNADGIGARLVVAGPLVTTVGGYGGLYVTSPDDARAKVNELIDQGADVIKIAIEHDLQGRRWPTLTPEETAAIVETAHACGVRVAAHVSRAWHVEQALEAGVDDVNHMAVDRVSDELIHRMVASGMQWVPTMELWDCVAVRHGAVDWLDQALDNLRRFFEAGGEVVLGTDFAGYSCDFDDGMPMVEILLMARAGMSPMGIIAAATRNAAVACGRADDLGTIEPGKMADLLIVRGDPLEDLSVLLDVRSVFVGGLAVREAP